jgi:hypothetical protein
VVVVVASKKQKRSPLLGSPAFTHCIRENYFDVAGAADDVSDGAADDDALLGVSGAGVPPPHAARAPTAAMAARSAAIAMFFMIVFSSYGSRARSRTGLLMP